MSGSVQQNSPSKSLAWPIGSKQSKNRDQLNSASPELQDKQQIQYNNPMVSLISFPIFTKYLEILGYSEGSAQMNIYSYKHLWRRRAPQLLLPESSPPPPLLFLSPSVSAGHTWCQLGLTRPEREQGGRWWWQRWLATKIKIASIISLFDSLLLVYRHATDFCILILYPAILPNSLTSSNSFLAAPLEVSMYSIMSSANNDSFASSFPVYILCISFFFFCLTAMTSTSNTMLNKSGERVSIPVLFLTLEEMLLASYHWIMTLGVALSYMTLYTHSAKSFIVNGCRILSKAFCTKWNKHISIMFCNSLRRVSVNSSLNIL